MLVEFKINGEIVSRQVIPELLPGEFTSLDALWTVPSPGEFNLVVETLLQGELKDRAAALLDAGELPVITSLDFSGNIAGEGAGRP